MDGPGEIVVLDAVQEYSRRLLDQSRLLVGTFAELPACRGQDASIRLTFGRLVPAASTDSRAEFLFEGTNRVHDGKQSGDLDDPRPAEQDIVRNRQGERIGDSGPLFFHTGPVP